ncbi:MMPL family transporter [Halorussus salilacus]|uniref:MMPL family transporter n=1 Tax=Halorussus salilacus TaxID=2953750 RepID=UPI0020A10659|nr:MMPL family transporter [Halorussus salilacus]USZ68363.1 MMPL family transporter [Halorussus salilacus]
MRASDLFAVVTEHSRVVIAVLLVLTLAVGAGAPMIEQSSSLDQFQSDSTAADKLDYAEENFSSGDDNTTTVQLILRGDNVLSKDALVESLEIQRSLRDNATVNRTLADDTQSSGISNVVATAAIQQERADELREDGAELERDRARLNATVENLTVMLDETREVQREYDGLNRSYEAGEVNDSTYRQRSSELESRFDSIRSEADRSLTDEQDARFERLVGQTRTLQQQMGGLNASYERGEINQTTYRERAGEVQSGFEEVYREGAPGVLRGEFADLRERGDRLQERQEDLQNGSQPTLDEQVEQLRSMNDSEVEDVVTTVLSDDGDGPSSQAFSFMPTSYDPGSTEANATMIVVFQSQEGETSMEGQASTDIEESQQAIQRVAQETSDREVMVFGAGIISEETDRSMSDSIAIVGPLALLFVVLTLLVAYRDLLDILLGVLGIFAVLIWTFGAMGWLGITFNQIFIAVPVLLIGLSIDYAIHVFMRHREERQEHAGESVRDGMRVALASVGVALTWVTATTVIGFLSNLISPVPPIQDFGIVSSIGILAALLVFGGLVPALKVELDSLLESWGFDRSKRAFGTGGGALGSALKLGSVAARKAPVAVLALTLVVSAGGAYGATQVDTSFQQEDFLAEDPPGWTDDLPEPFRPGEYSAKANLEFVNDNFVREDSQAQILVEGDVASAAALDSLQRAEDRAVEKDAVVVLSNGDPQIQSPLSVMESVADENESFNETFTAADTDGDGVPDQNVEAVYDELFEVAPDRAGNVVYREDGEYRAVRMIVSVDGGASSADVTEQMRDVAGVVEGDGLVATATGQPIVFEIVQQQLLDTVIQSLLITLVAVFAFLMVAYRLVHGSATLGAVTLLPVAFSVSWILGTMYLLGMPFNVLTGMITSLTVGLGVAYSIHLSERFNVELDRRGSVWAALDKSVTGTGGALLGSAATTVGGFGVLSVAILPALQQFGIITGLTIVYAFLASVLVLPSLLVLWMRYLGPEVSESADPSPAVANGGVASETSDASSDPGSDGGSVSEATGASSDAESDWEFGTQVDDSAADRREDD